MVSSLLRSCGDLILPFCNKPLIKKISVKFLLEFLLIHALKSDEESGIRVEMPQFNASLVYSFDLILPVVLKINGVADGVRNFLGLGRGWGRSRSGRIIHARF